MEAQTKIECGHDMGEGRKCHAMIRNRPGDIRAHMRLKHDVDPKIEEVAVPEVVADKDSSTPRDVNVARLNEQAKAVQLEQLARLRKNAPDIKLGTGGTQSELEQRTQLARQMGVIGPEDHPYWADSNELDVAVSEGREVCVHHKVPYTYKELTLTKRPKAIAAKLEEEQQAASKARFRKEAEANKGAEAPPQ